MCICIYDDMHIFHLKLVHINDVSTYCVYSYIIDRYCSINMSHCIQMIYLLKVLIYFLQNYLIMPYIIEYSDFIFIIINNIIYVIIQLLLLFKNNLFTFIYTYKHMCIYIIVQSYQFATIRPIFIHSFIHLRIHLDFAYKMHLKIFIQ